MNVEPTAIEGVLLVTPVRHGDERGFFSEVFKNDVLQAQGVDLHWVQDNHSYSKERGVVRGFHWQSAPFAQAKLVRVLQGAIMDVAVDLRSGSPTFGEHVAVELSAQNWRQLYVPVGFAHAFCTLTDDVQVHYKVTNRYAREYEGGLLWNDPALGIDWPINAAEAVLSARDKIWPTLKELTSPFEYVAR